MFASPIVSFCKKYAESNYVKKFLLTVFFFNKPLFLFQCSHLCDGRKFDTQAVFHLRLFYRENTIITDIQNIINITKFTLLYLHSTTHK